MAGWITDDLLRALGDELLRMNRRRATAYDGAVLDASAFKILWALEEGRASTLRTLAEHLQLEQSTINRQVNAAIQRELVEPVPAEGRSSRTLRVTEVGREAYLHDARLRADVLQEALAELGQARATSIVEELRELNDAMDRAHQRD